MKTLDRSRPYGVVYGGGVKHAFEQDGIEFDAEGNSGVEDEKPAAKPAKAAKPATGPDQLDQQLRA